MRLKYYSGIKLANSYVMTYRIYVLKHPVTQEVFYVGRTQKELKERLTGHLSSLNSNGSNQTKNDYIKGLLAFGNPPIIEEIEIIYGTCRLHDLFTSFREFHWMLYYKEQGAPLTNHLGIKTDAICAPYENYVAGVKNKKGDYSYYYCGSTPEGQEVYDAEKMSDDGFVFEEETYRKSEYYEEKEYLGKILTYEQIYDDENPNYICGTEDGI